MYKQKDPKNKKRSTRLLVKSLSLVAIVFVSFWGLKAFYFDNGEDVLVIHGPHVATNLESVSNQEVWDRLAAVVRSRFQNRRRSTSQQSAPLTTTTPVQTITSSPTVINTQPVQTTVVTTMTTQQPLTTNTPITYSPGFGIGAGGGLAYLGQSDLNNYFSQLKDLGVTWVRWDIDWSRVQPNNSTSYDWSSIDLVANTAKNYGIKSLAIITYAPKWAVSSTCPANKRCPPLDPDAFANFAQSVATRYKGKISAYEIWNEENYAPFWYPSANAQEYINLLEKTYYKVKLANPTVVVLTGGLAPTSDSGGSVSPVSFVSELYSSNAKNYFDALAFHPYSYPVSPDYDASWNGWQQMLAVHNIMISNNDNKKIWITEYGVPTDGPGTLRGLNELTFKYGSDYLSESTQTDLLTSAVNLFNKNKDWIGNFFWYSLKDDGTSATDPENFFGLIRFDSTPKPAYSSFKNLIISSQ